MGAVLGLLLGLGLLLVLEAIKWLWIRASSRVRTGQPSREAID